MSYALALFLYPLHAYANPDGGVVSAGQANITTTPGNVSIHQQSDKVVIDWGSFDIAPSETTQFYQPSASSIALNRVHSANASVIDGTLKANGNIIILNQNGVLFGSHAMVDVNGLVATTADIDNNRFMLDQTLNFDQAGSPTASIINQGTITAKESGLVGFVAPQVENSGIINARLGRVHLAAGDRATIDFYGDGLMEVAVSDAVEHQIVKNTGTINADGGTIAMTAAAGHKILSSSLEVQGNLRAQSVSQRGGKIVISSSGSNSAAKIAGRLDATGRTAGSKGGEITVTAKKVELAPTTRIDASGDTGGGTIRIGGDYQGQGTTPRADLLLVSQDVVINNDAFAAGNGGHTFLWSDGATSYEGSITARGGLVSGDGGMVEVSGHDYLTYMGSVDTSAFAGNTGTLLLDPADITVSNAANSNITGSTPFQSSGAAASNLNVSTLQTALGSSNVIISSAAGTGGNGDVTFTDAVAWNSANSLTVNAARSIIVNNTITNSGSGGIFLNAITSTLGDITINSDITTAGSVAMAAYRDLTLAAAKTVMSGATGGITMTAANNAVAGTGNLTLNGNLSIGTGALNLLSGANGTRPNWTVNTTTLVRQGATFGQITAQGFQDIAINRDLTSTGDILFLANRDLTLNAANTLTSGPASGIILRAANNSTAGTGNLTIGGNLSLGTGSFFLTSGINTTRPNYTLTSTNVIRQGAAFGTINIQGFQDTTINRDLNSNADVTVLSVRDLTLNAANTITSGAANAISLRAANAAVASSGNLNLNGILNAGTGALTLLSGANGTRPSYTITTTNLLRQGATFGAVSISGFQDTTINRDINSSGSIAITSNRDLTLNAANTLTSSATGALTLIAANNILTGSGNLNLNGTVSIGTGGFTLLSGVNGTRPNYTMTGTNVVRQGTTFGAINIQGYQDLTINRDLNSNGSITLLSNRDMTLNAANTITTSSTGSLSMRAANGVYTSTGNLNLNGVLSVGTGSLTLLSGINGTRPSWAATGTSLLRQGATFGAVNIQGFNDLTINRALNSSGTILLQNNTRDLLQNTISSTAGAVSILDPIVIPEGQSGTVSTTNQPITLASVSDTAGGVAESFTVNPGTSSATFNGPIDGVAFTASGGTLNFASALGATRALGTTSITSTNNLIAPDIRASQITLQTTGASAGLTINGLLNSTGAGNTLSATSASHIIKSGTGSVTTNNASITMNASNYLYMTGSFTMDSGGGNINLTGTNNIINSGTTNITTGGGNLTFNNALLLGAPMNLTLGSGTLAFGGTVNGTNPFSGSFSVLAVGAGGGGGGNDSTILGGGGGGGAVVDATITAPSGTIFTVGVGGGGGGGANSVSAPAGGTGGINGGGAGGPGGNSGSSGGGGAGGGWSGLFSGSTYYAVAGGGAGGGGANEGTANDSQAPGGGTQPNGNTGTTNGGAGANFNLYAIDGGGGGGGGGGYFGGNGQSLLTTAGSQASGGANYINSIYATGTATVGNNGATQVAGSAGGTAVTLTGARATYYSYGNTSGAGGTGNSGVAGGNGTVIIRYTGTTGQSIVIGGTATTVGGDTIVTYSTATTGGTFAPVYGCSGNCSLTASAAAITFNGSIGATNALDSVSLTTTGALSPPSIKAGSILLRTTGAASDLTLPASAVLTGTGAGNAITLAAGRNFVNNSGSGALSLTGGGRYLVYSGDPTLDTTNGLTNNFRRFSCTYSSVGSCAPNATIGQTVAIPTTGNGFIYRITPPLITVTPSTIASLIYGASTPNLNGYAYDALTSSQYLTAGDFAADTVTGSLTGTTNYAAGPTNGAVGGSYYINYSSGSLVSAMGYGFTYANRSNAFAVTPRTVTIALAGSVAKTYDGNNTATLSGSNYTIGNVFAGDTLAITNTAGTYDTKNAGTGKTVSVSGLNLSGTPVSNYQLASSTVSGAVGTINKATLTIAATASNKVYDGNANAIASLSDNRIGGDVLSTTYGTALFADKNAANGKTVTVSGINISGTDAGNYNFNTSTTATANITKAALTITASGIDKVYNGNDIASVTLSDNRILGDDLAPAYASALFPDKNVGTGRTVNVTGISLGGTDAGNYTFNTSASTVATITKATLTVLATGINKVYDATANALVTLSDNRVSGDALTTSYAAASFPDKNVGNGRTVNVSGINVTGADIGNYNFNTTATTSANITKAPLTISAAAANKVYDGNTLASVTLSDDRLVGDVLSTSYVSSLFSDKNAANGKAVTVSGIGLGGADAGNYSFNTSAVTTANILKAGLTVTADPQSVVYGTAVPAGTFTYAGFISGEDETFLNTAPTVSSARSGIQNAGTYAGNYTVGGGVDTNYSFSYVSGALTVTKKDLNITADTKTVTYGTATPAGSISYSGFISGEDETYLVGTPSVTSGLSGVQNAGTYNGNYTVSGGSSSNYLLHYFSGNLVVTKKDLNVTADNESVNYGTAVPTGTLSYSGFVTGDNASDLDMAPTVASALTGIQNAGSYVGNYTVSGGVDGNYNFNYIAGNFTVIPASLIVTASNQSVTYGTAVPTTTITYTGFASGEDESFLTTAPTVSSGLSGVQNAGSYSGNYIVGGGVDSNYSFTYVNGNLTVTKKALNVTSGNRTVTYGTAVPTSALAYTGFITGEDETVLGAQPVITSAQSGVVNAGSYLGNYAISGGSSNNYYFNYIAGNLTVVKKTLTAAADAKSITYGTAVPTGTVTYTGFVSGDGIGNLTSAPTVASGVLGIQNAGTYLGNFTVSGGSSQNYDFSYVAGDLVIGKKALSVSADNKAVTYGTAVPTGTISYAGFITGEDATFLSTAPTVTSSLSGVQNAGTYNGNYIVGGGVDANYSFTYSNGNLVVNKASLNIAANSKTMTYGGGNTLGGYTVTGLQNSDTVGSVTLSTDATSATSGNWNAGTFTITPSAAMGGIFNPANYNVTYQNGVLNILRRALNVIASVFDKTYDRTITASAALSDDHLTNDILTTGFAGAQFFDKNVGNGKTVTVSGIALSGADAGNYTAASTAITNGNITKANLTVSATGVDKVYDGTDAASVTLSNNRYGGDAVTASYASAIFTDFTVGTGKPISVSGITISGADAGNYNFNMSAAASANIYEFALPTPPAPAPVTNDLPNTVVKVSQNYNSSGTVEMDDGIFATPMTGYVLVYLPDSASDLSRLSNSFGTDLYSFDEDDNQKHKAKDLMSF